VEDPGLRNPLGLLGLAALLGSLAWAFLAPKPPAPVATTRPPAVVERAIAPDYTAVIAESRQKTLQALVSLKPGTYKIVDITNILNGLIINFATNSAEIPAEYTDVLQKSAAAIKSLPAGSVIDVIGHTDSEGDDASNMDLSKRRAEAVAKKLTEYGVDAKSLKAIGYGETKPKGDNSTAQGRFENRRIEFLVIK
jgi:OOP family OmpA-OmpF porin